ncbi:uncharacterized protein LOC113506903 isoform X2 [Trichoplusia ni]|uniref:Uncharacterized protein LOC113506903 isoform X2 n=1 Tax=Trichoplusia ni TaxID=7111 RepID=A0A7E5WYI3_TRINI|nr:uncharacterized protein LOC113506903 isoform X2 [Trichoplusia ni]
MSSVRIARMERMLFDRGTTYRNDYHGFELKPPVFTVYKEKPTCLTARPPPLKDVHTLSSWKDQAIPFNLLHKPRPIIDTDPREPQLIAKKTEDAGKENAIKTRPRLVMTPAVSMDDIENPRAREILCNEMYTSTITRATREAAASCDKIKAPFLGHPSPSNPITLPKLNPPYVSPEWRMETVSWDKRQLRTYCDPTKEFWLARGSPECRPCIDTAKIMAHRKRICQRELEKRTRLRSPGMNQYL